MTGIKRALICALFCSNLGHLMAQTATNLAGSSRSLLFSVPSSLPFSRGIDGNVVHIENCDNFEVRAAQVTVSPNGTFTHTGGEGATGILNWAGQGLVTAVAGTNTAITFQINDGLDTLVSAGSYFEGFCDLEFILRSPTNVQPGDFLNTSWNLLKIQTPARLEVQGYTNGTISDLEGRDEFGVGTGTMAIDSTGKVIGNMGGPFSATTSYAGAGQVNLAIDTGEDSFVLPFYLNAAKDLMAGVTRMSSSEENSQEFILAVRPPDAASLGDLQGVWWLSTFKTPQSLSVVKNLQGEFQDIAGKNDFETGRERVIAGHDGFFIAGNGERARGSFSVGAAGTVSVTVTSEETTTKSYTFRLNASKNVLAAVRGDTEVNELAILTKAPANPGAKQEFGLSTSVSSQVIVLEWASGTDRELQSSTNLVDWEAVSGTMGQHSYSVPTPASGGRFFRVVDSRDL